MKIKIMCLTHGEPIYCNTVEGVVSDLEFLLSAEDNCDFMIFDLTERSIVVQRYEKDLYPK